ncbi:g3989 [Coccomyxa elongata]
MDCDEPAVARHSTGQQCGHPPSEDTGPNTAQSHASSLLPLELSGVPSMRIEECLTWLAGHTHFDPAQTTAALCSVYDQQPLCCCLETCSRGLRGQARLTLRDPPQNTQLRHPATGQLGLPPLTAVDLADLGADADRAAAPWRDPGCTFVHSGTLARVAYDGWHTDAFPRQVRRFLGESPVTAALRASLAAHGSCCCIAFYARRLAQQQVFQPIRLPSGDPAPVMHQHADDTSIHARSPRDAQEASVKHLGIPLSKEPADAATALFTAIVQEVDLQIAQWSCFRLSLLGRAYVAKQMLASRVIYHATFIPVPGHLLTRLCRALHTFVAANRPPLFPGKEAASV